MMMRILFFLLFLAPLAWAQPSAVTVEVDDWKPYVDQSREDLGFSSKIIAEAFQRVGIEVEVAFKPWNRVSANIDSGVILSYPWFFNEERDLKWHYSEPIFSARQALMIRADSGIRITDLEDLRGYWVGTTASYSYGAIFDSFANQLQIDEANSDMTNIRKLLRGRIDLFPIDPYVGSALLQEDFSEVERSQLDLIFDTPFEDAPLHLVCAKAMADCTYFLEKFNEGLSLMQADGSYQAIIDQARGLQ